MKTNILLTACLLATPVFAEKLPPLPDGAFTYVVIPDTQRYHGKGARIKPGRKSHVPITGPTRNPAFESRVDWIVRNLAKERIFFVSHTGDIVDSKNDQQWSFASNLMTRFEWKVPYGVSPGNHDLSNFSSDDFNRYFPRSRYEGQSWYVGGFDGYEREIGGGRRKRVSWGNADSCQLAEADGHKFVFLHLECNAPVPVLKWVDAMLDRYVDRTAIICTHMFVGYRTREVDTVRRKGPSRPDEWFGVMDWTKCHGEEGVSGMEAWRTCFSKHRNLLLVISGDQGPAICWRETLTGENGNVVHATLQDYPRTRDDEDWIRLYRFLPKENRIDVWTYSPQRDEVCHGAGFREGRDHHVFSLPVSGAPVDLSEEFPIAGLIRPEAKRDLSLDPEWRKRYRTFRSTTDDSIQPFYWYDSGTDEAVPLVVALHSWGASCHWNSPAKSVLEYCKKNGWAMVYPNYRGPNVRPEACGSNFAVQDILDTITWAKNVRKIDADRIYIIGGSGGGHMSLLMAGRHPEVFAGAAAFCPITDLKRWRDDSLARKADYIWKIEKSCGGTPEEMPLEYAKRSPLTHLTKARAAALPVYIATGIHDGHTGSVPVGHSIRAFNALADEADRISEEDIAFIEANERIPEVREFKGTDPFYGPKTRVHLRATSANARLTIFEGGHGGNYPAGLDFLSRQRRGQKADMTLPTNAVAARIERVTK